MGEDNTSQVNRKSLHSTKYRRHHAVLPYILTPVIFVMISVFVLLPAVHTAVNYAVSTVHKAQTKLTMDFNEIQPDRNENENNTSLDSISIRSGQKLGRIVCPKAGVSADVYCGLNRVSLREGAALKTEASLPGNGKTIKLAGYRTTALKNIDFLKKGDIITFETMWGCFDYKVYSIKEQSESAEKEGDLVISTAVNNTPFSSYEDKQLYVYASPQEVVQ